MGDCCYRWWASRIEYETTPVQHVCQLTRPHPERSHTCVCGAIFTEDSTLRINHFPDEDDANDR